MLHYHKDFTLSHYDTNFPDYDTDFTDYGNQNVGLKNKCIYHLEIILNLVCPSLGVLQSLKAGDSFMNSKNSVQILASIIPAAARRGASFPARSSRGGKSIIWNNIRSTLRIC